METERSVGVVRSRKNKTAIEKGLKIVTQTSVWAVLKGEAQKVALLEGEAEEVATLHLVDFNDVLLAESKRIYGNAEKLMLIDSEDASDYLDI